MKKVLLVFGTRPEAIKMCPLVKEFQKHTEEFDVKVCVTGQHREMLDQVLDIFGVEPEYDLNIMKQGQDLYDVTEKVLLGLRNVLQEACPDLVLVHGDTTTSMAAALAAFYEHIPVGHVEAGLRTRNIYSPWPEEINRQISARIATYNFVPTPLSERNLREENVQGKIFVTGNTVIDALQQVVNRLSVDKALAEKQKVTLSQMGYDVSRLESHLCMSKDFDSAQINSHGDTFSINTSLRRERRLVLITGHRRENFGKGFINMLTAMKDLAEKYPDVDFVYPMHLNPNVRGSIEQVFGKAAVSGKHVSDKFGNFFFIEPLDYLEFVYLMSKSYIVLTDSGGIQEEAPGLGKPVLVMRDTTERPEALDAGTVHLVGTDYSLIISEVSNLLEDNSAYEKMSKAINPYGDGFASKRIVQNISLCLNKKQ